MSRLVIALVLPIVSSAFLCEAFSDCFCELSLQQVLETEKEKSLAFAREFPFTYFNDCEDA